ncbi:MAG: hypothetical protein V4613_14905 [Bacteroidota bacterium]
MKKIILLLSLLLSFCSIVLNAQKNPIKETKGKEIRVKKKNLAFDFTNAVKIDNFYYVIGKKPRVELVSLLLPFYYYGRAYDSDFVIYKLDEKMNYKELAIIPAEYFDKNVESYTIYKLGDKLCALFYFNNRKHLKQYLFAQNVDIKTLKPDGKPYKIAETPITKKEKRIRCIFSVDVTEDFTKMIVTADRTKLALSRRARKAAASQKNHTFTYWLYNNNFELINSGKNIKLGKGNTKVIGQTFDNEGNLCVLGFEADSKSKNKKSTGEDEDYNQSKMVMKIIKPTGEETDLTFAKGEYFYSAMLKLNPHTGNVAVVGLLSSGKGGAKGIFTQQVNLSSGEVLTESVKLFGKDLVKEINTLKPAAGSKSKMKTEVRLSKKSKPSKNAEPDYIHNLVRIGACHYNDSNELVVVTQKYYTYTSTTVYYDSKGNPHTRTITYYVYSDIISFKLDEEGEIENFGYVFHYTQITFPGIYKDYSSLYTGEKLYLITTTEGGQVELNNKASRTYPFKEYKTYRRKRTFADYVHVTDSELLHIMATRRKVLFTLMSVKTDM